MMTLTFCNFVLQKTKPFSFLAVMMLLLTFDSKLIFLTDLNGKQKTATVNVILVGVLVSVVIRLLFFIVADMVMFQLLLSSAEPLFKDFSASCAALPARSWHKGRNRTRTANFNWPTGCPFHMACFRMGGKEGG